MDVQDPVRSNTTSAYRIPLQDFNSALLELSSQPANWYRANYADACGICVQSNASRQFLLSTLGYMARLQNTGQDFSIPLVILAATMLQTGYEIGRKRAEAEILEGWMRL